MKLLKSKEAQIGILLLFIISLTIWGFNFLKGKNVFGSSNYYYCTFEDVGGLMESNFVVVQGLKIGLVENIFLQTDEKGTKICVRITLDDNLVLPKDTRAVLYNLDFLGTRAVSLKMGTGSTTFAVGDTLPSSIEQDMLSGIKEETGPIVDNLEVIMARIDSVLQAVQTTFSQDNVEHINNTVANLDKLTARIDGLLKNKEDAIGSLVSNLDSIAQAINGEKKAIAGTLNNIHAISDSLAHINFSVLMVRIDSTLASLNSISQKINESQGTLGLLVNDSALYDNLNSTTKSLDNLLIDLKRKPARYAHLSLIDWGKDVYLNDEGEALKISDKLQLKFGAMIKTSESALEINATNFYDYKHINERKQKGQYYYFYGLYSDYHACKDALPNIQVNYPNAEVIGVDAKKVYFFE